MSQAGNGRSGTGARLAARLVALKGVAPDPVRHVIFRSTRRADGTLVEGYNVPDQAAALDAAGLDAWLGREPTSIDRLAVAVLVIREVLDGRGLIVQCTIERRRGSADGPFCGDPVRVDFAGAAGAVRLYRSHPDGRLAEVAPSADAATPRVRRPEHFAGEQKALQARFGEGVRILDAREPTLFEDMVGLSSIVHVRTSNEREIGCGIGWHGEMPFVLEADFPRYAASLELLEEDAARVEAALVANDLIRGETRLDENGIAVLGRRRGAPELFLLRPASGEVRVESHVPGHTAAGADQRRWIHYVETYEGLTVLDAWHDGASSDLIVVSGDATGQGWRHHVDADGVETWRKEDDDAALGARHREHLYPGTLAAEDVERSAVEHDLADPAVAAPADNSLLARIEVYQRAMAALREARATIAGAPDIAATYVRELQESLDTLGAYVSSAAARPDAAVLAQLEQWLNVELSLLRCVVVAPSRGRFVQHDDAPSLPSAAYDLEEAAQCLALRRPTAAVFHCTRAIAHGIATLAQRTGLKDPVAAGDRDWATIMRELHSADAAFVALAEVRRCWGGMTLNPADKHTEEEAEQILQAARIFIRLLGPPQP